MRDCFIAKVTLKYDIRKGVRTLSYKMLGVMEGVEANVSAMQDASSLLDGRALGKGTRSVTVAPTGLTQV